VSPNWNLPSDITRLAAALRRTHCVGAETRHPASVVGYIEITGEGVMKIKQLISDIILELTRLQGAALPPWKEDDDFPFPRMIAVDGERTLYVSKKIDDLIELVSLQMHASEHELGKRIGTAELRSIVRRAFGPALAAIDLDHMFLKTLRLHFPVLSHSLNSPLIAKNCGKNIASVAHFSAG
jgi:hypothetical protein